MARAHEVVMTVDSTAVASTRVAGTAVDAQKYDAFTLIAELAGVGGITCDIWVEESWDGGTTWFEVAHFTQLGASAAAVVYRCSPPLDATVRTIGKNTTTNGTLAAGTVCSGPWGPQLRLVSRTGAGTPSGGTITQTVRIEQWQDADGR